MTAIRTTRLWLAELLVASICAFVPVLRAQSSATSSEPGAAGEPYPNMPSIAPIGVMTGKYFDVPVSAQGPAVDPAKGFRLQDFGSGLYMVTDNQIQSMFPVYPPTGFAGYADLRVAPTDEQPVPADIGAFRINCEFSHMNFDDPIIFPNEPGKSHLHAYFGNTGTNGNSTAESLATTGNSTCNGGIMNRSGYWVPPLIDTQTGAPVAPDSVLVYYKTGYWGIAPADVHPVPEGLRIIAGDHTYSDPSTLQSESVYWTCFDPNIGRFPTPPVEACRAAGGEWINELVEFPQCWDGVNLDSPNHKSHMANPVDGACPADHPVAIPVITMLVFYRIDQIPDARYLRLSSDMYPSSLLGGASIHGDYFSGWQQEFMNVLTQYCLNPSLDCHAHLLGDGRMFY